MATSPPTGRLHLTGCEVDLEVFKVFKGEEVVKLTTREGELLAYFAANPHRSIDRDELLSDVWGYQGNVVTRVVDKTVLRLRNKVELDPRDPQHILTVHGAGYRFLPLVQAEQVLLQAEAIRPARRTNLPMANNPFLGRVGEMERLRGLCEEGSHLVTVLGPGGTGKTRLACHFGEWALEEELYSGGVWLCDLSEARSTMALLHEFVTALDLSLPLDMETVNLAEELGHVIATRPQVLILLDNCEVVVAELQGVLKQWLDLAPEAVFLVTSRERLRLREERVLDLGPLGERDAADLLVSRASRRGASTGMKSSDPVVVEIVRRLEGMPLALELAAARVPLLGAVGLRDRLEAHGLRALGRGNRDAAARHQTMQAAIDWSWELLEPQERSCLAQLSVFRGGCRMAAAEAVIALDSDGTISVLETVGSLVDKSLVTIRTPEALSGHRRIHIYSTIRAYVEGKLAADGLRDTRERHAAFYADLGEDSALYSPSSQFGEAAGRQAALDRENLLAALDYNLEQGKTEAAAHCCRAAVSVLLMRGPLELGLTLCEKVLAQPELSPADRARLLVLLGRCQYRFDSDHAKTETTLDEAMACADEADDPALKGVIMSELAHVYRYQGRFDEALDIAEASLVVHRAHGERLMEGASVEYLGTLYSDRGRMGEAERLYREALAIHQEVQNLELQGVVSSNLASLLFRSGRSQEARDCYEQALDFHRTEGNRWREGSVLGNLGTLLSEMGDEEGALECYRRALNIHREVGNRTREGVVLGNLGSHFITHGDWDRARQNLEEALAIHRSRNNRKSESFCLGNLSELHLLQGDLHQAMETMDECMRACEESHNTTAGAFFLSTKALILARMGEPEAAHGLVQEAEVLMREKGHPRGLGRVLCRRSQLEHLSGLEEKARETLKEALAIAKQLQVRPGTELHKEIVDLEELLSGSSSSP